MATYRCYQFRASSVLLKADTFDSEAAAKRAAAYALSWEDCDRVEVWKDGEKLMEWARGRRPTARDLHVV